MIAIHHIESINFTEDYMKMEVNGEAYEFKLRDISKKLLNANELERNFFKISPSGYGIHWPLIDEDLAVDTLIK